MRLVWGSAAQRALRAIIDHYHDIDPALRRMPIDRIDGGAASLVEFPRLGPELPDGRLRVWHARNTPFILAYRVVGRDMRVVKVRHARSDWKP